MCLDNKCSLIFINKNYFHKIFPFTEIKKMFSFIPIRGVANRIIKTNKYAVIKLYVNKIVNKKPAKVSFFMEIHLINELKLNLLIRNDIFKPQKIIIDYDRETVTFGCCKDVITFVDVRTKNSFNAKRTIKTKSFVIIPPFTILKIPIIYKSSIPINSEYPEKSCIVAPNNNVYSRCVRFGRPCDLFISEFVC